MCKIGILKYGESKILLRFGKSAYRKIKIKKKEINLVLLSSFGGIGLVWLSYICDLLNTPILTPKDRLLIREIENLKLNYAVLKKK
jgi:hypothetical protein